MRSDGSRFWVVLLVLVLAYVNESLCTPSNYLKTSVPITDASDAFLPMISPQSSPEPLMPFLAPSPLSPFTNYTVPKLSGLCPLNFTAAETLMTLTSTDCLTLLAPYLANVVCCPQLEASLVILIGQSSKITGSLALNATTAKHCLLDFDQLLVSQGADDNLKQICKVQSSNLTGGTCPVKDIHEFESTVDTSALLTSCKKIDPVNECCKQVCQSAISDAAKKLMSNSAQSASHTSSRVVDDCRHIVLRWVASELDASSAKEVLRGLSNCNVNKGCPLALPETRNLAKECGNGISNQSTCCSAMKSYLTHLQNQSFTTNLQALNCAASLGMKLQSQNVTKNVYNLCHVGLKQFSLQAGTQESGCLLQSLPSDVVFDQTAGITFLCDLNDNIPAQWPSANQLPASSCNGTVKIPALPAAASGDAGLCVKEFRHGLVLALATVFMMLC